MSFDVLDVACSRLPQGHEANLLAFPEVLESFLKVRLTV